MLYHLSAFQNGKQMVQEGALTALASVADSSQVCLLFNLISNFECSLVVDVLSFVFACTGALSEVL